MAFESDPAFFALSLQSRPGLARNCKALPYTPDFGCYIVFDVDDEDHDRIFLLLLLVLPSCGDV